MKSLSEVDQQIEETTEEIDKYKSTLEILNQHLRFLREIRQRLQNFHPTENQE